MSRLLVVTTPDLVAGFRLAGVGAYAAGSSDEARRLIAGWLGSESGLLAIDETLYAGFDVVFRQRLNEAEQLPYLVLPAGLTAEEGVSGLGRVAALLREAVGFHITFQGEQR